mmetsp:Transcript_36080/g.81083  ORF Transcript_36080/g.81083 Transcript_36080/m.81083 type:complete len:315 (+) Transcript_36080:414-1358(+)
MWLHRSSGAFLVAVWCVAVATGQEQCRLKTGTMADQSPGDCNLDELPTAELEQICARTGFDIAMASIRRRQRDDPTPNHVELTVEAQKCLMLDGIRSSKPKKWTLDLLSLFYEQYTLFGLENADIYRHVFVCAFKGLITLETIRITMPEMVQELRTLIDGCYEQAGELFRHDATEKITDAQRRSLMSPWVVFGDQFVEIEMNLKFFKIAHLIKLNDNDEKNLLRMLSYLDPNALERLISGDIPDLKSMQPRITIDWIVVSIIGVIALVSAFLLKRSGIFARNGKERDEEGQRAKGGGKKKGRRKRMPADKAVRN